jgi:hypothetical protein
VLAERPVWVAVGAFEEPLPEPAGVVIDPSTGLPVPFMDPITEPRSPFMDTLQVVVDSGADPVNLLVMRRTVMEEISQVSFLIGPLELDPARGHAVIQFVDELGNPLPDLRLIFPTPDNVGVAYDVGEIYGDSQLETSTRGTVVLLNVPAAPYPGVLTNVVVETSSTPVQQFRPVVRVATESVTVLTVELDVTP